MRRSTTPRRERKIITERGYIGGKSPHPINDIECRKANALQLSCINTTISTLASALYRSNCEAKSTRRGMSSNPRAVEAAQGALYLSHAVSHHGPLTLSPPQNTGRTRKQSSGASSIAKGKRKTGKPKRERTIRAEEGDAEPRFNLGAPAPRASKRRSARAAAAAGETSPRPSVRQDGSDTGAFGEDIEIPDYPPPSFEEAISTTTSPASTWVPQASAVNHTSAIPASHQPAHAGSAPSPSPRPHPGLPNPAMRFLSIIVEPSSSPQISPVTPSTALPSPSPTTSASQSNAYLSSPISPSLDSDSDSLEIVTLPSDVAQRQWDEDRRKGLTWQDRTKREWERHLATRTELTLTQEVPQQPEAGPSRSKSQMHPTRSDAGHSQMGSTDLPPRRVPASWRETLDEPTLTHMASAPVLKRGRPRNSTSPLAHMRPLSPTGTVRPYHINAPSASSLSLTLGHLHLPSAFSRSTVPVQTGGVEMPTSSPRRRLFTRGKGKDKDRSFSDGDLDDEEEPFDSWEVIPEKGMPAVTTVRAEPPEQSTTVTSSEASTPKVKPRLTLIPHLRAPDAQGETHAQPRGAKQNDTRVDPFPINIIPSTATESSPEVEEEEQPEGRPSSIMETPINCYPPNTVFSGGTMQQPVVQPQPRAFAAVQPRQRCASGSMTTMRGRPVPPPPMRPTPDFKRPAPIPPPMRAASPYAPASPLRPSPLSGTSAPARDNGSTPVLTPTILHNSPSKSRGIPPPPPRGILTTSKELHERALNVPLPVTPSDGTPRSGWPSLPSNEYDLDIEREVERVYGYAPAAAHACVCGAASTAHTQSSTKSPRAAHNDIFARVTRPFDYTHQPLVPSRLALSIPSPAQQEASQMSLPSSPMSFMTSTPTTPPESPTMSMYNLPTTPRSHYAGRPLPLPPHVPMGARPMSPSLSILTLSAPLSEPSTPTQQESELRVNAMDVPEAMLIDFEAEIAPNAIRADRSTVIDDGASWVSDQESIYESAAGTYVPSMDSPPLPPAQPLFSEFTELDLLVSRMHDGPSDGTDYEALLALQEVVGPAIPFPDSDNENPTSPTSPTTLLGPIEVERRRVTKDGHVRVKLSLLGAPVNKCGICLAQFKSTDLGALGKNCQHCFHDKCLRRWLQSNQTCPICRIELSI